MTQAQRASVWQRKDQLAAKLKATPSKAKRQSIQQQIEVCNQELITDTLKPPVEAE